VDRRNDEPAAASRPAVAATPPQPVAPRIPHSPLARAADQLNPFVIPQPLSRPPAATTNLFDLALDTISSLKLPYGANPTSLAQSR
jgi:hypothetical protein